MGWSKGGAMPQLDPLTVGWKISIRHFRSDWNLPESGLAVIEEISPEKIWLRLSQPVPPLPLREGEPVRIQSTTKEALYFWDAEVFEVSDPAEQAVTISILGDGITVQRRERSGRHNPIPPWQTSQ